MVNCRCRGGGPRGRIPSDKSDKSVPTLVLAGATPGLVTGRQFWSQWSTWPFYVRSVWLAGDPGPDINGGVVIYAGAKIGLSNGTLRA